MAGPPKKRKSKPNDSKDEPPPTASSSSASPSLPPLSLSPRHHLTYRTQKVAKAICEANKDLSLLNVNRALDTYTRVLNDVLGHPVTFLNRSLCYLLLGFPNLAAIDAHRALSSAEASLKYAWDPLEVRTYLSELHTYVDQKGEKWKKDPTLSFV